MIKRSNSSKGVLYAKHGVKVTPNSIEAPKKSYPLAHLNEVRSVRVDAQRSRVRFLGTSGCFGLVGTSLWLSGMGVAEDSNSSFVLLFVGALLAIMAFNTLRAAIKPPEMWTVQILLDKTWIDLCTYMADADAKELNSAVNSALSNRESKATT